MTPSDVFDRKVYDALVAELGPDDTAEVLGCFLADTSGKLARLATQAYDRPLTKREGHAIKSSAATFGFVELSRLAQELETGAQAMSPDQLQQAVAGLQRSFAVVRGLAEAILPVKFVEIAT